jgi:outer membrane protein TolC
MRPRLGGLLKACVLFLTVASPIHGQVRPASPFVPATLQAALGTPPAVSAAQAEVARASARHTAAGASPTWFISAGASEVPDADFSKGNLRIELGRDILPSGRRAGERDAAAAELERAAATLEGTIRRMDAVLIRAVSRSLGWELIRRRRAAQDSLLMAAEEALRARFGTGEARYLDVLRLRTERLRVTSTLASAQAEARGGEAVLGGLAGDSAGQSRLMAALTGARQSADALEGPLPDLPDVDSLTAASTPVLVARTELRRAEAERALDLAEHRTQGSAFAGIQRIGQTGDGSTLGPTIGITLSLPFLTSGAIGRIRAAADSSVSAAQARVTAAQAEVSARLGTAVARYAGARERVTIYDPALLRGARAEREAALANYRAGTVSLVELLDFERALVDAEIGRFESMLAAADAWADLLDVQAGEPSTDISE